MSRVLLVSANREHLPAPVVPLGLLSVAASLREHGHQVDLADLCFEPDPACELRKRIAKSQPDVVGIGIRNLHTNAYDPGETLVDEYRQLVEVTRV